MKTQKTIIKLIFMILLLYFLDKVQAKENLVPETNDEIQNYELFIKEIPKPNILEP